MHRAAINRSFVVEWSADQQPIALERDRVAEAVTLRGRRIQDGLLELPVRADELVDADRSGDAAEGSPDCEPTTRNGDGRAEAGAIGTHPGDEPLGKSPQARLAAVHPDRARIDARGVVPRAADDEPVGVGCDALAELVAGGEIDRLQALDEGPAVDLELEAIDGALVRCTAVRAAHAHGASRRSRERHITAEDVVRRRLRRANERRKHRRIADGDRGHDE